MAKTLKDKGEEKKELSEEINKLISNRCDIIDTGSEHMMPWTSFKPIDWRFMTAQQMRKTVTLLEEV